MLPGTQKAVYDPVPPYDLNEIESNRGQELNNEDDINTPSNESTIQTQSRRERCGRCGRRGQISQRECCCIAFSYFLVSVIGVVLIVLIVAHYNYLTRKNSS